MNYFKGMEKYWNNYHHTLFGSNSAKIQLYSSRSSAYQSIKNTRRVLKSGLNKMTDIEIECHQTIFYDERGKARLPAVICQEIASDNELTKILNTLEANEVDNILGKENATIEKFIDTNSPEIWYIKQKVFRYLKYLICKSAINFRANTLSIQE